MSQSVNGVYTAPTAPTQTTQQSAAASSGDATAFAAALAQAEEQQAAETATSTDTAASSGSGLLASMGMDGSMLSTMLLSGMGGISGGSGLESGGGMSSIFMFILMFLFMNKGESFGGVSSSDLPSFPELSPEDVQEEGSDAAKAFAAFEGEYGPIVDSALSRLGDPYSQPKAGQGDYTDCSYLSRWCYRQLGVELPRTAAAQGKYCEENNLTVEQDELQPGDLIFYSLKKNGRYRDISHVGIYAGNGMMVDASSNAGEVVYRPVFGTPLFYGRPQISET